MKAGLRISIKAYLRTSTSKSSSWPRQRTQLCPGKASGAILPLPRHIEACPNRPGPSETGWRRPTVLIAANMEVWGSINPKRKSPASTGLCSYDEFETNSAGEGRGDPLRPGSAPQPWMAPEHCRALIRQERPRHSDCPGRSPEM